MAQIESKHDVRRKVRDAQAQANRERLQRESDNREDMVAFLVAEQKVGAVSHWKRNGTSLSGWKLSSGAPSNAWRVPVPWQECESALRP